MISKLLTRIIPLISIFVLIYGTGIVVSKTYDILNDISLCEYKSSKKNLISNDEICKIFDCVKIKKNNISIYYDKGTEVYSIQDHNNVVVFTDHLGFDFTSLSPVVVFNNNFIFLNITDDFEKALVILEFIMPFFILFVLFIIISTIMEERKSLILTLSGNEALLTNKTMLMITENIHHELNTPLEVLNNKIEKIHRILAQYMESVKHPPCKVHRDIDKKLVNIEADFDFIKTSSEQIYSVLEKMKGFKNLKYSNGNKTIKDILDGAFNMVSISNSNFEYKVDDILARYQIGNYGFKNVDLLNITINHIKNSLEANASMIYILFESFDTHLKIRIIDNGLGIPIPAQKNIFKPNFSTKDTKDGVRGNGMYLNKHILASVGGNIELIESSNKGTTIEITLPCKLC